MNKYHPTGGANNYNVFIYLQLYTYIVINMQINKNNQAEQMLTLIKFELNFSCHLGDYLRIILWKKAFRRGANGLST